MKQTHSIKSLALKIFLSLMAVVFAGAIYFIYFFLPAKVVQSIVLKSKTHQPLTTNPRADGFAYQDVSFTTKDGISISGWWMEPASKKKPLGTLLLTHGIFKNREQVLTRAEFLVKAGYQVLLFDQRGSGLSGESPVSGGVLEAGDYLAAEDFLKSKKLLRRPLVYFGFSLGAISALRAAAQAPDIDAVIADSPLPNVRAYVSRRTMGGSFSVLPGFLSRCVQDYDRATGLALTTRDLDLTPIVQQFHEIPVLYITGEKDDLARSEEVRKLFDQTNSHHRRLVYIPDAGHVETYSQYPLIYEKAVISFLSDLRDGFPQPDESEFLKKAAVSATPHNQ